VRWTNLFEHLPTLAAMVLAPWHFFRRLPQTLNEYKPWYKSPLRFFGTLAVYVVILYQMLAPPGVKSLAGDALRALPFGPKWFSTALMFLPKNQAPTVLLTAIVLLMPLWMALIGLCMFVVVMTYEFLRSMAMLPSLNSARFPFPILNPCLYLVPLNPKLYFQLQYPRLWWGPFYFGLLALAVLFTFSVVFGGIGVGISTVPGEPAIGYTPSPSFPLPFGSLAILGCILWLLQRTLITPYVYMLRSALPIPTKQMYESDAYVVTEILKILSDWDITSWGTKKERKTMWIEGFLCKRLCRSWMRFRVRAVANELDLLHSHPDLLPSATQQMKEVFSDFQPSRIQEIFDQIPLEADQRRQREVLVEDSRGITAGRGISQRGYGRAVA
jgi:hypothetical protein